MKVRDYLFSLETEKLAEYMANVFDCNNCECPAKEYGCISCKQSWVRYLESEVKERS